MLDQPACHLLTLVGPGGIGKTRLVLEVAHQKLSTFFDGVIFVPLVPISRAENIPTAIAGAFNIHLDANTDATSQILTYLRDKTLLLVLDNFEIAPGEAVPFTTDTFHVRDGKIVMQSFAAQFRP